MIGPCCQAHPLCCSRRHQRQGARQRRLTPEHLAQTALVVGSPFICHSAFTASQNRRILTPAPINKTCSFQTGKKGRRVTQSKLQKNSPVWDGGLAGRSAHPVRAPTQG